MTLVTPPTAAPELTITVGPGPRNAHTDPNTGLRFYEWQGRELPSVTTIRRLAGIPHGLHQWSLSKVIERAIDQRDELAAMLTRDRRPRERVLEKNRREEASKWLRAAATEERDAAAELGTAVHDAAAQGTDPEAVAPELRPRLLQFRDWLTVSGAAVLASEFQVWNLRDGYAGTADLLCSFPGSPAPWLVDLKTGKGTYPEHAIQLMLYRRAEFVGQDGTVDQALTMLLAATAGIAILHLADDHWEFRVVRDDPATWEAARGLLQFAMWTYRHPVVADVTVGSRRGEAVVPTTPNAEPEAAA